MPGRWTKVILLTFCTCLCTGCARTQFTATSLPARLAARPIRDYSLLDLTAYASANPSEDVIRLGDRLQVDLNTGTLTENAEHTWPVSVDEFGQAAIPNIGAVKLAGLTSAEAAESIVQTSFQRDVFLTPTVAVSVADRRKRSIVVAGAVNTPGAVTIHGDATSLADVIVRAGGLTSEASGAISVSGVDRAAENVVDGENAIRPVGHATLRAQTVSLAETPESELGQIMIPEGAVVHVEESPPRPIQVVGVISNQAVEVPAGKNVRLLDAITLAGGQTYSNWISDRVTIIRREPGGNNTVRIKASIRKAKADAKEDLLLAPYDIVSVEENALTFTLSTLSGFIGAGMNASRTIVP
ncbi:MAG: polysaccharide biosynthesis/export family protein [Fuerstiella sp.]|jgi:protein involved in polysaccharide export with SLBB domain|nr:polysaccharide biosynthesis/export family protein [Fuerstiella sp.]